MRIVIATGLYPPDIGGPATYTKLFEERLPQYGIEVSVLPFRTVRSLPPIIRHVVYAWKLAQQARSADIIFVQDTVSTGFPAALVSLFIRKPLILRVPGDYAWEQGVQRFGVDDSLDEFQKHSYGLRVGLLRVLQRFVVNRARRVIAPSQYIARIVAGWSAHTKKIEVIYNGIEMIDEVHPTTRQSNLIVSAGRLVPWKGFEELIDLVGPHREWRLHILGDGPLRSTLSERIRKFGPTRQIGLDVAFSRTHTHQIFAEAAVFVLNSRYEGLSHTLLEAMAAGAPVVTTRVGGNPEVVEDGVNGILFDVGDSVGLERALSRILGDEDLRKRLGSAAAERAQDFSIDRTLEKTAALLKSSITA